jgi:hypothetical protein
MHVPGTQQYFHQGSLRFPSLYINLSPKNQENHIFLLNVNINNKDERKNNKGRKNIPHDPQKSVSPEISRFSFIKKHWLPGVWPGV